jgi:hypothetical protein
MFILAGITCIVFGVSQIWLKDLWWYDAALLGTVLGIRVERTVQWDRHRDLVGYVCGSLGVLLLVLHLVMV